MQPQRHVARGMGKIKTNDTASRMTSLCDRRHIEQLSGIIIDAAQQDQGNTVPFFLDTL